MFVETDKDLYLPDLSQYVVFEKCEDKGEIAIKCDDLFKGLQNRIKSIEIYYNSYTTNIDKNIENAKYFNIFTKEEV